MNTAVIMATYGRPTMLENAIACFEAQTHPKCKRRLLIYDDGGQVAGQGETWNIMSSGIREATLVDKYDKLVTWLNDYWPQWDAITVWDDDDIMGPRCLEGHAKFLESPGVYWSYPVETFSLYQRNVLAGQVPQRELTGGRFWWNACVRRDAFDFCEGFHREVGTELTFDQWHLGQWQKILGGPGRPDTLVGPQGCYGWGRSHYHDSACQRPAAGWRPVIGKQESRQVQQAVPKMDDVTLATFRLLGWDWDRAGSASSPTMRCSCSPAACRA